MECSRRYQRLFQLCLYRRYRHEKRLIIDLPTACRSHSGVIVMFQPEMSMLRALMSVSFTPEHDSPSFRKGKLEPNLLWRESSKMGVFRISLTSEFRGLVATASRMRSSWALKWMFLPLQHFFWRGWCLLRFPQGCSQCGRRVFAYILKLLAAFSFIWAFSGSAPFSSNIAQLRIDRLRIW